MTRITSGLVDTIAARFGSEPPAEFTPYERLAWGQGFEDAANGITSDRALFEPTEWRREAWRRGHEDYHRWRQEQHTPAGEPEGGR